MRKKFQGIFHFTKLENGDLEGKFTNNESRILMDEKAKIISSTIDFVGIYKSSWTDIEFCEANLKISSIGEFRYELEWQSSGTVDFRSEAYSDKNILIGRYWKI